MRIYSIASFQNILSMKISAFIVVPLIPASQYKNQGFILAKWHDSMRVIHTINDYNTGCPHTGHPTPAISQTGQWTAGMRGTTVLFMVMSHLLTNT